MDLPRALDRAESARGRPSCSSASSSAVSCGRRTAARPGPTTGRGPSGTCTRSPGTRREPGRAYEAAGGGAAWSKDGGDTWEPADDGRDRHYTWALAVDPADPDRWYVSASPGPYEAHGDRPARAAVYRRQGGGPWEELDLGLPRPLETMPYALVADGGRLIAGLRDGRILASEDAGDTWGAPEGPGLPAIVAMAAAEG